MVRTIREQFRHLRQAYPDRYRERAEEHLADCERLGSSTDNEGLRQMFEEKAEEWQECLDSDRVRSS